MKHNTFPHPSVTVDAVMTTDCITLSPAMTAGEALQHIRTTASEKKTVYTLYVIDDGNRLLGMVSLRDLLVAHDSNPVQSIMTSCPDTVSIQQPPEQALGCLRQHAAATLPVIDAQARMMGIVTIEDAVQYEQCHQAVQGTLASNKIPEQGDELDILTSPLRRMFTVRVFWLIMLTVFGTITSTFVATQAEILSKVLVLAAFIAPIVDMGGNTGSQSATLVIRSMALGELNPNWYDIWFVIKRELPVSLGLGVLIAGLESVLALVSKHVEFDVLLVVGLSMLTCTILGGIIGGTLPFLARRMGTDPATLSSPLITSIMDLVGVCVYFGLAHLFLGNLLYAS